MMSSTLRIAIPIETAFLVGAVANEDLLRCGMVYTNPEMPQMMRRIPKSSIYIVYYLLYYIIVDSKRDTISNRFRFYKTYRKARY